MTKDEFFTKLQNESVTNKSYTIELLKLRGFFFEKEKNRLILSDNSHRSDESYLKYLLEKCDLGKVVDGEIMLNDERCDKLIQSEFRYNNQIGCESCFVVQDWKYFKRRIHGRKVEVSLLEPFIARYIKAISACGVMTVGSCDGNHPQKTEMVIMFEDLGSILWHKLICKKCLEDKFDIDWRQEYTKIRFSEETRYDTYYEVNKAAEYLYNNRKEIRRIKAAAFQGMSDSYLKKHKSEEIGAEFVRRASELFDSSIVK